MKNSVGRSGGAGARAPRGIVYLVGAGPGDPELLTWRARKLLRRADVVIHDALVGEGVLALIRPEAVRIDVGKRCGGRRTSQEEINSLLVDWARRGRRVVRLKGGDPFVFGRGGEEALALREAGVRFEVVPGVTAGIGVSAYAGIPLTQRDLASSATFITGHGSGRSPEPDWEAVARLGGTLVVYMGLGALDATADKLLKAGRPADTPAAVVERGTLGAQRVVTAPLEAIGRAAREAGISAPALVIVGEVVRLSRDLSWFDCLPFRGRRVLVVRTRPQPSRLAAAFRRRGADVAEFPKLRYEPLSAAAPIPEEIEALSEYRWVLFTSPAGVDSFWDLLARRGEDSRALGGVLVAGLGKATIDALRKRGIVPEVRARTYDPTAVIRELNSHGPVAGARILFPRERNAPSAIAAELRWIGARVDEIETFNVSLELGDPDEASGRIAPELIVLPSSTAATLLARSYADSWRSARVLAIGPGTAETALGLGVPVHAVADVPSIGGCVAAAAQLLTREPLPESDPAGGAEERALLEISGDS